MLIRTKLINPNLFLQLNMNPNEKKGWTEIITPDDLDRHMAELVFKKEYK